MMTCKIRQNGFFKLLLFVFVVCAIQGRSGLSFALTFNTCADDFQYVYADGVLLDSNTKTFFVDLQVKIPDSASVVGVKVTNGGGPAGWKGYFSDGRVADASWKCTSAAQSDNSWTLATFDDKAWAAPLTTGTTTGCGSGAYATAKWLWTESTYSQVTTIYCRKRINYCQPSPCQRGTCVNSATGYSCSCPAGYQGTNCADRSWPIVLPRGTTVKIGTTCALTDVNVGYCVFFDGAIKIFKIDSTGAKVGVPVWQVAGKFGTQREFALQGDGNLCIHDGFSSYTHDWNSPNGKGGNSLVLLTTGQLAVLDINGAYLWMTPPPIVGKTQSTAATFSCAANYYTLEIPIPCK